VIRRTLRDLFIAVFFALAASEHQSFWVFLDSRPVVVLPIGQPTIPLVAPRN
jgi:hypothetical protein